MNGVAWNTHKGPRRTRAAGRWKVLPRPCGLTAQGGFGCQAQASVCWLETCYKANTLFP